MFSICLFSVAKGLGAPSFDFGVWRHDVLAAVLILTLKHIELRRLLDLGLGKRRAAILVNGVLLSQRSSHRIRKRGASTHRLGLFEWSGAVNGRLLIQEFLIMNIRDGLWRNKVRWNGRNTLYEFIIRNLLVAIDVQSANNCLKFLRKDLMTHFLEKPSHRPTVNMFLILRINHFEKSLKFEILNALKIELHLF